MIFWILLFILVIVISYLLAYLSMRNFHEAPTSLDRDYGLFLIRKTSNLTPSLLSEFNEQMLKEKFIISFERLFKGHQSTLVIFAPRKLIQKHMAVLDLVELEDYINVNHATDSQKALVFQMGTKNKGRMEDLTDFFAEFPDLAVDELVFWQLTLQAKKNGEFEVLPRVVFLGKDEQRRAELGKNFQNLHPEFLHKVPRPFSQNQMLKFYKTRTYANDAHNLNLAKEEILKLILLNG